MRAVLGEDEVVIRSVFGELNLRVERFPVPLSDAEREDAERAVFALRTLLEFPEPRIWEQAQRLARALSPGEPLRLRERDTSLSSQAFERDLLQELIDAIARGRIRVQWRRVPSLTDRRDGPALKLPPRPKAARIGTDTFYEVRFVDETGQGIPGVTVDFEAGSDSGPSTTNPAGVALLENVQSMTASIQTPDPAELEKALEPRWAKRRPVKASKEGNTTEIVFRGAAVGPLSVKPAVPNTVRLMPPLGRLFLQLFDRTGRVRHVEREYSIDGPEKFSGVTDEQGSLLHEDVFPGDYTLTFTLVLFEGDAQQSDTYTTPLVVLPEQSTEPETRLIGALPFSVLARLRLFFNTNKTFVLPSALAGFGELRQLYANNPTSELLVVGHADTAGGIAFNDQLSLERAESTIAFLKDDVDAWLKFYDAGVLKKKRWGPQEDRLMLLSVPDLTTKPPGEEAVRWFQRTRGLKVDGKAGPETRRRLITEYMALDGASLEEEGLTINATAHGCGEHFPLDDAGEELDAAPADEKRDPIDRRVELFFFDPEFGIAPKPPGKNSKAGSPEYPLWRKSAIEELELTAGDLAGPRVTFIEMIDALFRTNSAVVLPEGENPEKSSDHAALTSVGVIATALRFNQEHPGKKLFVAGHTDTTATVDFNQKLSEERARCALALLLGNATERESFKTLCDQRHTVSDYKQILSWVSRAFPDLTFDCDPGRIDDNATTGIEPVRRFQRAYNTNKAALGATAPDLNPDGAVGPLTWGAFFDCYEFALQQELGEDATGLQALRDALTFVDDDRKALGFSEHFPIEELGVDHFKSQTNRRVEILYFDSGEEPDLEHAEEDPETSELYLPGVYVRISVRVDPDPTRGNVIVVAVLLDGEAPYVEGDTLLLQNAAGEIFIQQPLSSGSALDNARRFTFVEKTSGDRYRAVVVTNAGEFLLFDQTLRETQPETL